MQQYATGLLPVSKIGKSIETMFGDLMQHFGLFHEIQVYMIRNLPISHKRFGDLYLPGISMLSVQTSNINVYRNHCPTIK